MNKIVQVSSDLVKKKDDSKCKILLYSTKIISDVTFSLSLANFLPYAIKHNKIAYADAEIIKNLMTKQGNDSHSSIEYNNFCERFESENRVGDKVKTCKRTSQISRNGKDLINALNTFLRFIGDLVHINDDENKMRMFRMKHSKENELRKKEIASLTKQMENCMIEFHKYEQEKKYYDEQIENAYLEANINKVRLEEKNKHDMLIYLENFGNGLDELEKLIEEKQKKLVIDKQTNSVEIENLQSELFKKEYLLKMTHSRYCNDMLNRRKKKEGLQRSNELKTKSCEILKEKIISMETNLKELKDEEHNVQLHLKRESHVNVKSRLGRQKTSKKKHPKKGNNKIIFN